jgi:hypothetical protein
MADTAAPARGTSLTSLISLSIGVNAFELYSYEWFVANDKSWSNDPPGLNWHGIYGEDYREALDKASNRQLVML